MGRKRCPKKRKEYNLWTRYRITLEEHKRIVNANKGICEICNKRKGEVIDHCHETGEIRGHLCHSCNRAIGLLGDSCNKLVKALDYLTRETTHGIPTRRRVSGQRRNETLQDDG